MNRFPLALLAILLLVTLSAPGCKRRPRDELASQLATEQRTEAHPATLAPLTLTDDTPDLALTWVASVTRNSVNPARVYA